MHSNYFNAYAQNMRIKSFYSLNVDVMSTVFKDVSLLDRVTLQLNEEATSSKRRTFAGEYFVDKISTILDGSFVTRRYSLVREGFNADSTVSNNSK